MNEDITIHDTEVQLYKIEIVLRELLEEFKKFHAHMPSSVSEEEYNGY